MADEFTSSPSLVLDLLKIGIESGLDVRESIEQIGESDIMDAFITAEPGSIESVELLQALSIKGRMDSDDEDMKQALALTEAGWTAEDPRQSKTAPKTIWEKTPVMGWKWRRPAKRPGRLGRLYHSTNQAFQAMKKEPHGPNEAKQQNP